MRGGSVFAADRPSNQPEAANSNRSVVARRERVISMRIRPIDSSNYPVYRKSDRVGEEVVWFATEDDSVIGVLVHDRADNDFGGVVLALDDIGRYRGVDLFCSLPNSKAATHRLHEMMRDAAEQELKPDPI
jgi:hypothetical protein